MEGDKQTQMVRLLNDIISSHSDVSRKSLEALTLVYNDTESTIQISKILSSRMYLPALRKRGCELLNNRLTLTNKWQELMTAGQAEIKAELWTALKTMSPDDDESLQLEIVRLVCCVMELVLNNCDESEENEWNEAIFDHIEALCRSIVKENQRLGAIIFKLMFKTSSKMMEHYLIRAQRIFMHAVKVAEKQKDLATTTMEHLLSGWEMAIPVFRNCSDEQDELAETLPYIMQMTHAFAYQPNPKRSCRGFDVLVKLNKYVPELVWPHLKLMLDELFLLASDTNLSDEIRVQAVVSIRNCVETKRRQIVRLQMMDKLLMTLYGMLSVKPPLDANGEELYMGEAQEPHSPLYKASETLLFVAAHSDTTKLAERALRLMQPQFEQQQSPLQRSAAHVFLALMAKGFTDLLTGSPLDQFVSAVEKGVHDAEPTVRRAAHYALASMAENLQPEITRLAPRILPLFNEYFDQLTPEQLQSPNDLESITRTYCTLEVYCESLRPNVIRPHLPELMKRLLSLTKPETNSTGIRQMSLSAICSLTKITKELFTPHFDDVLAVAMPLVKYSPDDDELLVRTHAIQVMNALSRVNAEKFAAQAPKLLDYCVEIMDNVTDGQVFAFELIGVLSGFIPDKVNPHFSRIMNALLSTVNDISSSSEKDSDEKKDKETEKDPDKDSDHVENDSAGDGHGDQTESESDSDSSESSEESEKSMDDNDEALICLKAFAINMPDALFSYLPEVMRRVATFTESLGEIDKWTAYDALTQFVILFWRKNEMKKAQQQCTDMLPSMIFFVQNEKETTSVLNVMGCIKELLAVLKSDALACDGLSDMIFTLVHRILRRKLSCQFNVGPGFDMECLQRCSQALYAEQQVMEAAGELLPLFGYAITKRQFSGFFNNISYRFIRSVRESEPSGIITQNQYFLYRTTTRCMEPLGVMAEKYYDVLCFIIVDCMMDSKPEIRNFAMNHFKWLLNHSSTYSDPQMIIQLTHTVFIDSLLNDSQLDTMEREDVCGILGCIILTEYNFLPLEKLVPLLYDNLPLQHILDTYTPVIPALLSLYKNHQNLLQPYLTKTLGILMDTLEKEQFPNEETRQHAIKLLDLLKLEHKSLFDEVGKQYPDAKLQIA